jgi:molecular chaperone DnaK (HSP70)
MFADNHILGKFHLDGIPNMRRGEPKIEVTFDIDANGILIVSAEEKSTNNKKTITITNETGRISKEDVERLLKEAEMFKEDDLKNKERIESRNELENYLFSTKMSIVDDPEVKISAKDKTKIQSTIELGLKWLDENMLATKEELDSKKEEVTGIISPIISKLYKDVKASGEDPGDSSDDDKDKPSVPVSKEPVVDDLD